MTPIRPLCLTPSAPSRFVGDIAFRPPASGTLGWPARLGLIGVASSLLWGLLFMLFGLLV